MNTFQRRQLQRSLQAIRDVRFVRHGNDGIVIRLQAYRDFAPVAFNGVSVTLELDTPGDSIAGRLEVLPADAPRGTWYAFHFIAAQVVMQDVVRFTGSDLLWWSNIRSAVLAPCGVRPMRIPNPFPIVIRAV